MTLDFIVQLANEALYTIILITAPMLIAGLVVGLSVGIFQAVTSIHEMTLTFIPKILAVALALILFLPWILRTLLSFTVKIYGIISMIPKG